METTSKEDEARILREEAALFGVLDEMEREEKRGSGETNWTSIIIFAIILILIIFIIFYVTMENFSVKKTRNIMLNK